MAEQMLRTNHEAIIEVLSPLHVGAGSGPLVSDYDFACERGTVWVMDPRRVLDQFSDEELRHGVPEVRLSKRLGPGNYQPCAAYSLASAGAVDGEILPCIKDVEGRPYLPGSSLKGALRTAVAQTAARETGAAPTDAELGRNPKYAASGWERRVFGRSPNYDLLRALMVDDTKPVAVESMELALVSIHSLRGKELAAKGPGFRFHVEAFKPGTRLSCRVGIGEYALSHPRLGLRERRGLLDGLARSCRERAAELIAGEKVFYADCRLGPLQQFYDRLERFASDLRENQFLIQMSWGTGWNAKTLGKSLVDASYFQDVRQRYRLGYLNAPFPKSRRLVERGGVASEPLGWVKVTL